MSQRRGKMSREDRRKREERNARRGRDSQARAEARAPEGPRVGRVEFQHGTRAGREQARALERLMALAPGRPRASKGGKLGL